MKDLPSGWECANLGDLCQPSQYGWTTSATTEKTEGLRFLRTTDITKGPINWRTVPYCADEPDDASRYRLAPGDILISRAGSVGFSAYLDQVEPSVFASYLIRFRPAESINGRYLAWFLKSPNYWAQIKKASSGITLANVNAKKLSAIDVPIAPVAEQGRIVAAVEEQFSRLDAGVAALERVRQNLKRMRAAVLQAAVTGHSANHQPSVSTGQALLRDVLSAREKHLVNHPYSGSRRPPAEPDTKLLPPLPADWTWATVDQLSTRVTDGVHKKPNYVTEGVPFVTVRNLTAGAAISFDHLNYITPEDHAEFCRRSQPEFGDLLLSKDGTLGVVRAIRDQRPFSIFVSVALIKPVLYEMTDYLEIALSAPIVQRQMVPKGTGLQHIHLEDLRADCIPLPPLNEQKRIAADVQCELSRLDYLESGIESLSVQVAALRNAILAAAFSGKLAARDSNDEPASALLERIATERVSANGNNRARTRKPRTPQEKVVV